MILIFTGNEQLDKDLESEFKKITNNDSNFTVRIDSKALSSNPFWTYRESEIIKQVYDTSFGYFVVYAQDYYSNDILRRIMYYISYDV